MGVQVHKGFRQCDIAIVKRGIQIAACYIAGDQLYSVHVQPRFRRKKYGHLLMNYVVKNAPPKLYLGVCPFGTGRLTAEQTAAFYAKWGFRFVNAKQFTMVREA